MATKRVLVTGGSRGIGKAIALELAREGWDVAIQFSRDRAAAEQTMKDLGHRFGGSYMADLELPKEAASLWAKAEKDGPLHALVNNAGVYMPLNWLEATDAQFEANYAKTMAVNFDAPLRLCRLAAKAFAKRGGGKVLNVCSRVGFRGEAGAALYSASKAALINITRALAVELAPANVHLFGIAPGWVDTAMSRQGMQDRLQDILKDIPLGRMAKPEDCAAAAAFLLSDKGEYLSGVVIDINGASYFH
ncbi:MAG: SDR family oxidoreductase [Fimbriimonadaceae bacterium]|nr:SDR family oxidoreductase [Fimbriimonadaceae bacterium]